MFKRFLAAIVAALGVTSAGVSSAQSSQGKTILKPVPILVRVPNGFQIPARTNGASRRRKSNRLRISKLTRNSHR